MTSEPAVPDPAPTAARRPSPRRVGLWLLLGAVLLGCTLCATRSEQDLDAEVEALNSDNMRVRREALFKSAVYDEDGHTRLGEPQPGDWLHARPEPGQRFDEFALAARRRSAARGAIVFQPLGELSRDARGALGETQTFAEAFFGCPTRLAPPQPLPEAAWVEDRRQYRGDDLLEHLSGRAPPDALIYAGVTERDLFTESLNFVFGLGGTGRGVGVYSFLRFREPDDPQRYLRRCLHIIAHELGHTLGMAHCTYYRCVMNGINSLDELDRSTLHACPVCLRKLQHALGFEVSVRYRELEDWYRAAGLAAEADWVHARRAHLEQTGRPAPWREDAR
ncbi:MAG: archaemetzincin [Planctomycetota bacterium]